MKGTTRTVKRKLKRAHGKLGTSAAGIAGEVIRADMKKIKGESRGLVKISANGASRKNGATGHSANMPVFKHPGAALEAAIQRYVDLFDFAPIGYVSFDGVGHIEEINVAAARILGDSRDRLVGRPFAHYIIKEDSALFLNHLLRCRSSERRVETELHLKKRDGEIILVHLASSPMTSSRGDGTLLYPKALI